MSGTAHPGMQFTQTLKALAEGRLEPDEWFAWWSSHAEEFEAACPRGWFLRLKPRGDTVGSAQRATLYSQEGACYVLGALNVAFERSDRYKLRADEEFRQFCARERAKEKELQLRFAPGISLIANEFPKLARFLKKRSHEIDQLGPPSHEGEILATEKTLGAPLPAAYRAFLKCTRSLQLNGFSLGLDATFLHPAKVAASSAKAGSICIGEYWLEADGDQVVLEFTQVPDPDPPIFYYAHEKRVDVARKLAASFTAWVESLARSPIFRQ